jgi:AraC-like DNA-binding protein/ligand-binding sensor protein
MTMNDKANTIERLAKSKIYKDYERAFCDTTQMPVTLRPTESWQLPHHSRRNENPFCALMAEKSRACAVCMQTQQRLTEIAQTEARTITCAHGLCDTAVPVKVGDLTMGFLQTGQVFRKKPTTAQFERTAKLAAEWEVPVERERLKEAYFQTKVLSPRQHESVVGLLSIFAQHLSIINNQIMVQLENSELPMITRAKEFIRRNQAEGLSLAQVAKAVNTSKFYFCKLFKKTTGLSFTNYVSRVRVEKAKNLLLNPNLRISEIAYEVGFQSLTHFNRIFKKIIGQSPTDYRVQLKGV